MSAAGVVVEARRFAALVAACTRARPGASPPFLHELDLPQNGS